MNEFNQEIFRKNIEYFIGNYSNLTVYRIKNQYFGLSGGKEHYWFCKFSWDCTFYITYRDSFLLRRVVDKLIKYNTVKHSNRADVYYFYLKLIRTFCNSKRTNRYFSALMKK